MGQRTRKAVIYNRQILNLPQLVERLYSELFAIPWGHLRYIIDKCSNDSDKALFYVRQTLPWLNMRWNQAVNLSEYPNMSLKNSILKRLKEQCHLSKRSKQN